MDTRILNQFNNLYIITNNPDDVIPYKYFTNSFNGIPHNKIDLMLENLNIYKSSVNYNNIDNIIITSINKSEYLLNKNNVYYRQFIENYSNKDKFKLLSVMGVKEKCIPNIQGINKDVVTIKEEGSDAIDVIIKQLRSVITSLEKLKKPIETDELEKEDLEKDNFNNIDLGLLLENTIKLNSIGDVSNDSES